VFQGEAVNCFLGMTAYSAMADCRKILPDCKPVRVRRGSTSVSASMGKSKGSPRPASIPDYSDRFASTGFLSDGSPRGFVQVAPSSPMQYLDAGLHGSYLRLAQWPGTQKTQHSISGTPVKDISALYDLLMQHKHDQEAALVEAKTGFEERLWRIEARVEQITRLSHCAMKAFTGLASTLSDTCHDKVGALSSVLLEVQNAIESLDMGLPAEPHHGNLEPVHILTVADSTTRLSEHTLEHVDDADKRKMDSSSHETHSSSTQIGLDTSPPDAQHHNTHDLSVVMDRRDTGVDVQSLGKDSFLLSVKDLLVSSKCANHQFGPADRKTDMAEGHASTYIKESMARLFQAVQPEKSPDKQFREVKIDLGDIVSSPCEPILEESSENCGETCTS